MNMAPLLAATQNASMFDPVSPPAESIRNVSILALAVTGFIFVIVEGVLLYCLVHFRRSRAFADGRAAADLRQSCPSRSPGRWGRC